MNNMTRPEGERIATLEQHMVDQDKVLSSIQADIKDIKVILIKQDSYESRLTRLENSTNLWKWLTPVISGLLTAAITFLLISFIQSFR